MARHAYKIYDDEIAVHVRNAELMAVSRVAEDREGVMKVWRAAFLEETRGWLGEHMSRDELVFLLSSVAHEWMRRG